MEPIKTLGQSLSERLIQWMIKILTVTVWTSTLVFGLYILTFYAFSLFNGALEQWNDLLPELYDPNTEAATTGIGIHFFAGGVILILGCIQLLPAIRQRYLNFHRITGRIYVLASILAAIGGLSFIFLKGTIGGWVMDVGFAGYGILMFWAAIETIRSARAKRLEKHRAWAIRLFALAIGSWLYRMDYGFWFLLADGWGHTSDFHGPFDNFMSFFFYLPNLLVAEIIINRYAFLKRTGVQWASVVILFLATAFLGLGSFFFIKELWGPAIVKGFIG